MVQCRETDEMLARLGIDNVERLFDDVPDSIREDLSALRNGLSEQETRAKVESILGKNSSTRELHSFLGGGIYDFYTPSIIRAVISRGEFLTSYTPYQPEVSQGLLQSLFEYQGMMSELMGMEVVNNSLYDQSTGLGEAILMSRRLSKGNSFLVPEALDRARLAVAENYCKGIGIELRQYRFDRTTGTADLDDIKGQMTDDTLGLYFETPNTFGVLETQLDELRELAGSKMLVAGVNPLSLAVVRPPGEYEADIAIAEAQMFGNAMNFGGPLLGVLACRKKYIRKMPGRVVGMTSDAEGYRAFTMTLQTREQHIRREKATSNICSNEALTAVATACYLASMGGTGLREMAISCMKRSKELAGRCNAIPGCSAPSFSGPHFNEFTLTLPRETQPVLERMLERGVLPGLPLSQFPGMDKQLLVSVSDKTTAAAMDALVEGLKEVLG